MQLPTEIFGDVIVAHTLEELGEGLAEAFEAYMREIEPRQVVLDLDNTETIDSAGLTAVLNAQDELRKSGGNLKIATSNAINRKILEITRLDQRLEAFDSVIDAVKSYQ